MPKFRKKPVVIEAVQLRWDTWNEMCEHAGVGKMADGKPEGQSLPGGKIGLVIPTLEGVMVASENDWVIRGVKGELYPCKPDIFEATYEPVSPAVQKAMAAFDLAMVEQKVREGDAAGLVSVVAASKERRANDESASNAALCAVANDLNHERCSRTSGHDGAHASDGLSWHDQHVPQEKYGGLSERQYLKGEKDAQPPKDAPPTAVTLCKNCECAMHKMDLAEEKLTASEAARGELERAFRDDMEVSSKLAYDRDAARAEVERLTKALNGVEIAVRVGVNEGPIYCDKPECVIATVRELVDAALSGAKGGGT